MPGGERRRRYGNRSTASASCQERPGTKARAGRGGVQGRGGSSHQLQLHHDDASLHHVPESPCLAWPLPHMPAAEQRWLFELVFAGTSDIKPKLRRRMVECRPKDCTTT